MSGTHTLIEPDSRRSAAKEGVDVMCLTHCIYYSDLRILSVLPPLDTGIPIQGSRSPAVLQEIVEGIASGEEVEGELGGP